jgi:hypothetical protein
VSSTIYQPPSQQQQQQYGQQRQYGQPRQSSAVAAGFPALIPDVPGMPQYSDDPVEARWIDLFRNPGNYFDNRDKVSIDSRELALSCGPALSACMRQSASVRQAHDAGVTAAAACTLL